MVFTVITGGITVTGDLDIFLGLTEVPNSIDAIGSWLGIVLASPYPVLPPTFFIVEVVAEFEIISFTDDVYSS